jgi:YidC/Oxa1 family membrane protein insertase
MDRTGKIGVAFAIIVLVVWQLFYSKQMEQTRLSQEKAAAAQQAQEVAGGGAAPSAAASGLPSSTSGAPASSAAAPAAAASNGPVLPKVTEVLSDDEVEWTFSNLGGGVAQVKLLKHLSEGKTPLLLNEFGGIPIGAITESFESTVLDSYETEVAEDRKRITFKRLDARQISVEKKYSLQPRGEGKTGAAAYRLDLEVRFVNRGSAPATVPAYAYRAGSAAALHIKDMPLYTGISRMSSGSAKYTDVTWFSGGGFLGFNKQPRPVYQDAGQIQWAGVTNQYYSTILTPLGDPAAEVLARPFQVSMDEWTGGGRSGDGVVPLAVDGALRYGATVLEPGKELVRKFAVYSGPREHWRLRELGGGQEQIMDFGMFGFVSKILLASMSGLHGLLGSYAAAIIVLTLIIKTLMWPMQNKSTASMKKMQDLQPKMTALREKYADDPTRMNQELLGLYKKHGVNPMAGCLPMLVQIPIFFGFYNMLGKAVELRNSPFLWVTDLSQPDTVAVVAGFPINVLPILMAGTMLYQMRLTPKTGDPVQQRMFMFMPLIFVVFCYNYASGLALYWTVQNVFTIVQLLVTNRNQRSGLQVVSGGGI